MIDDDEMVCPHCSHDSTEPTDYSFYTTLKIPGYKLFHEECPYCWCAPEIAYDKNGVEFYIHQRAN